VSTGVINQGRHGRSQKIRMAVPLSTVRDALKDDPAFAEFIGY
jgi:hypothetical protein